MRVALVAFVLCLSPAIASAEPPVWVPTGGIGIVSPGTAELGGYQIAVAPNGDAVAVDLAGRAQRTLSSDLTKTLFADALAAMPLSKLPAAPCAQPLKAPAPVVVSFNGETSPNVACLTDGIGAALFADVQSVARVLYVNNLRSRALPRFAGGQYNQPPNAPPATQPPPAPAPGGYGGYGHM